MTGVGLDGLCRADEWTLNGETLSGTNRWTRVFVKEGGIWTIVLAQSTRMPVKQ
jgi:rhamnogalacturonyl hydrolase YesR